MHRRRRPLRRWRRLQAQDAGAAALGVRARRPGSTLGGGGGRAVRGALGRPHVGDARDAAPDPGRGRALDGRAAGADRARARARGGSRSWGSGPTRSRRVRAALADGPLHAARARRRGARGRVTLARPPAGAGLADRRGGAAGRDHRGARGPSSCSSTTGSAPPPAPAGSGRRARPPARARAPAVRRRRTSRRGPGWGCARPAAPTGSWSSRRSRCSAARAWVPRGLEPAPPHVRLLPRFDGSCSATATAR